MGSGLLLLALAASLALLRVLPRLPWGRRWLGQGGTAATPLRPARVAHLDGERVDVVSEGGCIEAGQPITVIRVDGNRIVVRWLHAPNAQALACQRAYSSTAPRRLSSRQEVFMAERDDPAQGQRPWSASEPIQAQGQQQWQGFRGGPLVGLVVLVVALLFFWSSWFTVQPQETGIVQRFGKVVRSAGPGLHFKWPFGVETVRLVPTARVLTEEFGFRTLTATPGQRTQYTANQAYKVESLMLTGDLNVLDVQWVIQYRIEDPIRYLFQVRDTPKTVRDISEAVMRRVVGNRLGSDVLTVGRVAVSSEAKDEIQKVLTAYETGVRLVTVELQDVTPPDTVKPAFNEVNESRQDRERTINQAQEQAYREIPKARGVAAQSISEAEGYALERVNRASGEATRFQAILDEYQQAPEVTRRRLYLEALGSFLADLKGLYIVDSDQKALVPWLPLDAGAKPLVEGK